ncbi:AAA family ATPase [Acidithiobacillus sp.]|uniref:AAA family ATPase n=1 Tax=Acidithiobacillus sp. TaxID=1872118 RepID=UPI0025C5543B|nr:AAA family ATPase [Acidithiobacillus sp.]
MIKPALIIRHLIFTGPTRTPAALFFEKGLNVLYGASETGKSFALEAIDYMLGGKELRDIPERVGYDRALLGIDVTTGGSFTLVRSTSGGQFLVFDGLHQTPPGDESKGVVLISKHNKDNKENISTFLLGKIGLQDSRLKSNARGETKSLSFRNLCHLCLVDEQDIQKQGSPIEGGQATQKTTEYSLFKVLLTGVDDKALVSTQQDQSVSQSKAAKIEVIDELLAELKARLDEETPDANELKEQCERLEKTIIDLQAALNTTEEQYQELTARRVDLRKRLYNGSERRVEIDELKARFLLLDEHYRSDLARLEGIREAGSLVNSLDKSDCPLCGALPEHQHSDDECDGNLSTVVAAADAESEKIVRLRLELESTIRQLDAEATSFDRLLPKIKAEIAGLEDQIRNLTPNLSEHRSGYTDLLDLRAQVRDALRVWEHISELTIRKEMVEKEDISEAPTEQAATGLSSSTTDVFAQKVEAILKSWNFPDSDRVFFDEKNRDLVISGKRRGARGKGMRSITHAAFSVGLLEFCKENELAHPGFLVLDSPLLAYREPESKDDDLSDTDVQDKFYAHLAQFDDRQILVIENVDPPDEIRSRPTSIMFSKSLEQGRYGFFPV